MGKEALTLIEAKRIIGSELKESPKIKQMSPLKGINHIIAEDVLCTKNFPVLPKSTMDGFVVSSKREKYFIKGEIPLRVRPPHYLKAEDTYQVYTGSFLPVNSLYVIKKEMASINQGMLLPISEAAFEKNFIDAGEDCKSGEVIVKKGEILSVKTAIFLSMAGIKKVKVYEMPKVGILPIGSELVHRRGPDLTGFLVQEFVRSMLAKVDLMKPVPDSVNEISTSLLNAIGKYDVLITIGGTGMSDRDLTTEAALNANAKLIFKNLKLQPGKTTGFFTFNETPLITLPGNAQAAVAALFALLPITLQNMGFAPYLRKRRAVLNDNLDLDDTWTKVLFVKALNVNGCETAEILNVKPHALRFILEADALLFASGKIPKGSLVDITLI
ncbi:MAG: molybdopterin-binding protein [Nitrososphaeria archaeon]